jgi:hypothetical protein
MLERFWNLESIGILPDETKKKEREFVHDYQNSSIRLENGHYNAKLPWKANHPPLPTNEEIAKGRTRSTVRRLATDPEKLKSYNEIITEQQQPGQLRSQGFSVRTRRNWRKPWSGPVTCLPEKWQYLTATRQGVARYSLMKYTSLRNKYIAKRLLDRYQFMCRAKFVTNQLKSMKTPSMFSKIYRYFWRFSTTDKAGSKLNLGASMQVVIHTKFTIWLLL